MPDNNDVINASTYYMMNTIEDSTWRCAYVATFHAADANVRESVRRSSMIGRSASNVDIIRNQVSMAIKL